MAPRIMSRAALAEGEEDAHKRTRVDDTDPSIDFHPGPSPYQGQSSSWVVVNDPIAYEGSAVMTNRTDASLTFSFPGDNLALALLYKGAGTNVRLTLENGSSVPFEVTAAEASASAPNGDKEALQRKVFHLVGLPCKNHTATLTPATDQTSLYFDSFAFPSADNPAACIPTDATPSSPTASATSSSTGSAVAHDHEMEYAGIGVGAAILGFIFAILFVLFYRRRQRRRAMVFDQPDRTYRPRRNQESDDTLNASQRSAKPLLEQEAVFRPRGIHAFAHNESFGSGHTDNNRQSVVDSPSANAVFPLMPMSYPEHVGDIGYSIGRTFMELRHDRPSSSGSRDIRQSLSQFQYEKARFSSSATRTPTAPLRFSSSRSTPDLIGRYGTKQAPRVTGPLGAIHAPSQGGAPPRRPCTASAVDRLRSDARQLDVRRPLSPFDRSRPTTSAGTASSTSPALTRLATAPANSAAERFRRNSSSSIDTHWSRASAAAEASFTLEANKDHVWAKSCLDVSTTAAALVVDKESEKETMSPTVMVEKTTDSEAEMWVSKRKILGESGRRRRNSSSGVPRRPPKSPHRPSTGQRAPPPMSYQPFTIS